MQCEGLRALADFRGRGGTLEILPGNHDLWLCPFYQRALGATLLDEPHDVTVHGLRLHLVHGHLLGARKKWKSWMEGRQFFRAFGKSPRPRPGCSISSWNGRTSADWRRTSAGTSRSSATMRPAATAWPISWSSAMSIAPWTMLWSDPRMIVLGGWQERSSYLMIDSTGASFHVVADEQAESLRPAIVSRSGPLHNRHPRLPIVNRPNRDRCPIP